MMSIDKENFGQLHLSWQAVIGDELEKPYMQALRDFLRQEKAAGKTIYPPSKSVQNTLSCILFQQISYSP